MDQRTALKILLQHSYFLSEKSKLTILDHLDQFTDQEIKTIGRFLALEKNKSLKNAIKIKHAVKNILEK